MKNKFEDEDILELIKDFPRVKASPDFTERVFKKIAEMELTGDEDMDTKIMLVREMLKQKDLSKRVNGHLK